MYYTCLNLTSTNRMKKGKKEQKHPIKTSAVSGESAPVWLLPLLLLITFIVFSPSLKNELINTWDDAVYITDNHLTTQVSAENIKAIFTQPVGNNYNPLPVVVFAVIRSFVDLDPFLYHLVNILFHLLCVALLFWLVRLMDKKIFTAVIVTVLFAIHPMRVESVTWVTELKDVMFASFYFATLITYLYWLRGNRKNILLFLLILVFAIFSLLSKIQAVSLPLSMLLLDYLERRQLKFSLLVEKIPFFILSAATGLLGVYFLKEGGSFNINEQVSLVNRFLFGCYSLGNYFVKLFLPVHLSAYYPYPQKEAGLLPWMYYVTPLLLIIAAVIIYKKFRANRVVIFGLLFFLFNVVFVLQIVGAGKAYMADRFTYVPYFGLFFIVAYVIQIFIENNKSQGTLVKGVCFLLAFVLAVLSYQRTQVWKNSETLWTDCIEKEPKADVAYDNRGVYYHSVKQNDKALNDYNMVVQLNPEYSKTYNNRGNIYFETGQNELALADYNKALAFDSSTVKTFTNRALIFLRKKEYAKAEKDFAKAISLDPNFRMIYYNRGLYYDLINEHEKAIADFTRYLQLKPSDGPIINSIGVSYQKLNQHQKAMEYFSQAIAINSAEPVYWQNRSYSEFAVGQKESAKADILKANQLGIKISPAYLQQLGLTVQ